jgi:hypothetical protein
MAKRELIDTGSDKRFVRRNRRGQFNEVDDVFCGQPVPTRPIGISFLPW